VTCVLLVTMQTSRWVSTTALTLTVVAALSFVAYWYLWGEAFNYADSNRAVPWTLDAVSNLAMVVGVVAGVAVLALGVARLVTARIATH
jgi:hypothetical protein